MTPPLPLVGADFLPVPDGVSNGQARLGVQVTPDVRVSSDIDLENWPSEIAAKARSLRVHIAELKDGTIGQRRPPTVVSSTLSEFFFKGHRGNPAQTRHAAATELWREIFKTVEIKSLHAAIAADPDASGPPVLDVVSPGTRKLQMMFDLEQTVSVEQWSKIGDWVENRPTAEVLHQEIRDRAMKSNLMAAEEQSLEQLKRALEIFMQPAGDKALADFPELEDEVRLMAQHFAATLYGDIAENETDLKDPPCTEDWGKDPVEAAGRKLGSLLSIPTLAHYFGLGVQIELDATLLDGLSQGAIAVDFDDGSEPTGPLAWTAFTRGAALDTFMPLPEVLSSERPETGEMVLDRGVVDLGVCVGKSKVRRFVLRADDVVNKFEDRRRLAERALRGELKLTERVKGDNRRRGLVLYDSLATLTVHDELEREAADRKRLADADKVNFAEDLIKGYRPDFAVIKPTGSSDDTPADRWRSVTRRTIVCEDPLLDPDFYKEPAIQSIAARDDGFTKALVEQKLSTLKSGAVVNTLSKQDEMFAWAGESLAVAMTRGMSEGLENGVISDRAYDLGLTLIYDLPAGTPGRNLGMPPLREGLGYLCGCRVVYANGAGPTLDEASLVYTDNPGCLAGDDRNGNTESGGTFPLVYPAETTPAPDIHFRWDDPSLAIQDPSKAAPGESSLTLAVRDGIGERFRVITPPRCSFDAAELQGQFDTLSAQPHGILNGTSGVWLFGSEGSFPEARFGKPLGPIRYLDEMTLRHVPITGTAARPVVLDSEDYRKIPFPQSRGTVAIVGQRNVAHGAPGAFFADRNGRELSASLVRTSLSDKAPSGPTGAASFWPAKQGAALARPIFLSLRPTSGAARVVTDDNVRIDTVNGGQQNFPALIVHLPPGERYDLNISANGPSAAKVQTLSLVHAVQKPISPEIASPNGQPAGVIFGLNAINVTVAHPTATGTGRAEGLETWAEKVSGYTGDMLDWPSEAGGATTYFAGRVWLDRKSSETLRCDADWVEYDEKTVTRTAGDAWIRNLSSRRTQLFSFEVERWGDEMIVDLVRTSPGPSGPEGLRELSYAFPDGRARKLATTLTARSAFTAYYPANSADSNFEITLPSPTGQSEIVWTECVFRPPPPRIDRILPRFDWSKVSGKPESTRRTAGFRIYLDEGWYASGEDETLGLVLLNADHPSTVCDYETGALEGFHRFICRAGGDPIHATSPVPIRLETANFPGGDPAVIEELWLSDPETLDPAGERGATLRGARPTQPSPLSVRVIPVTPAFTETDGLYCDINVSLDGSHMPFLQLGLVRYQAHAVKHLRLSHPIEYQVQLPPERQVVVDPAGTNRRVLTVSGPGYAVPKVQPDQPDHRQSVLDVRLLEWSDAARQWLPVGDAIAQNIAPQFDPKTGWFTWKIPVGLTGGSDPKPLRLLIEEYEQLPADRATGTYSDGRADFEEVATRRLVFQCLQDFKAYG